MSEHRERALDHLSACRGAQALLDQTYSEPPDTPGRNQRLGELHQVLGHGLKVAHVEALLDIGVAIRENTAVLDFPGDVDAEVVRLVPRGGDES